jgi:hypothetical protein
MRRGELLALHWDDIDLENGAKDKIEQASNCHPRDGYESVERASGTSR